MKNPIKVLVVDDSEMTCKLFHAILQQDPEIGEIRMALDAFKAQPLLYDFQPDVITLDVNMPRMDGLTFLKFINKHRPTPTLVVSALTQQGSNQTLQAFELGAVDVLPKPSKNQPLTILGPELVHKVIMASQSNLKAFQSTSSEDRTETLFPCSPDLSLDHLVLLAASTGGTEAIKTFLSTLPPKFPPIAIVLHIQDLFSQTFAQRLNQSFPFLVKEAANNDPLLPNTVLLAPPDKLMNLKRTPAGYSVFLEKNKKRLQLCDHVCADHFFNSAAQIVSSDCSAAVLTGMGKDGSKGLLALKQAGALTAVQDEASSVVFGMPKAALDIGAATNTVNIKQMAHFLLQPICV